MLTIRPNSERGGGSHGWLETRHTFSFADYHDPAHMGFRALRVINEDRVAPGRGFGAHGHRDMEIVSYVLDGALEHKDSMGHGSVVRHGDVQRMSAGTGVQHSEWNGSDDEPLHFLQIWIVPDRRGIAPSYEQASFGEDATRNRWALIASPDGAEGSVRLHQDARIHATRLDPDASVRFERVAGRHLWIQVAKGEITVETGDRAVTMGAGDGASTSDEDEIRLKGREDSEVLLFDLG